ncbi:aromatic amino acid hydroxylase [Pedobacter sp. P351]|uniref:aromatic amino acid hydroxylase n=1 Tax=Pedobacter superstes TaxID=3133441 RepID=UPI0030970470
MATFNDFNNPQVAALPSHLKQFIVDQQYEHYTPIDQAVWRYVMRQNYSYLKDVAYYPYIPGLQKAGLSIEYIPHLQEMNDALSKIGWGAVTVDGFIPPSAFMEYQAYRVLVIAADIRQLKHIEYTPAPDIIHESAGHAPIIADKKYHEYLSYFGSIGAKAMFSAQDFELYEAIRALSILKEMPDVDITEIRQAEELVAHCQENIGEPSEMALLSRLHWWTVEYGLIGTLEDPKIYGAGLLSSIGESASCMNPEVKKIWYTLDAVNYPYDITQPQPQLFVTSEFQNLINVLEAYADTMSFRIGGTHGIKKAIESGNTCTAVYSSGIQVSGRFSNVLSYGDNNPFFIKTTGPTALALNNKQLAEHGKDYYRQGFSSPIGKLKNYSKPIEDFDQADLIKAGIEIGARTVLKFESGLTVSGIINKIESADSKILLIQFSDCMVTGPSSETLFAPKSGLFNMAAGAKITSVYCGAADKDAFEEIVYKSNRVTYHPHYDDKTIRLHQIYQQVRDIRQCRKDFNLLVGLFDKISTQHKDDWLCALEILEILEHENSEHEAAMKIRKFLKQKTVEKPELKKLISDGFYLIEHPIQQNLVNQGLRS